MTSIKDYHQHQAKNLPVHLRQFIAEQPYEHYTAADHALWRYLMKQNDLIHGPDSIANTCGLNKERIPTLQEMNDALNPVSWTVVAVADSIPPFIFMELLSQRVLPVSTAIRSLSGIDQPVERDIFYAAALCSLIFSDPDFLYHLGLMGSKAIYSVKDLQLQQVLNNYVQLKKAEEPDLIAVRKAEKLINFYQKSTSEPSELTLLTRLYQWTTAYGLIGTPENHRVFGAAFHSSIKEYNQYQNPEIKKYHFTIDALQSDVKPIGPQDYYFVFANTQRLNSVLKELGDRMAFVCGGTESILKAIAGQTICTAVYSSGLQVSAVFSDLRMDKEDKLQFIKTTGPTALSYAHQQLENQGKSNHPDGFSSPVGRIKHLNKPLEDASEEELEALGIRPGAETNLYFESGLILSGTVLSILRRESKNILISFTEASLKDESGNSYFKPSWGRFDMAVGESIVSVYAGAADKKAFEEQHELKNPDLPIPEYDEQTKKYHRLVEVVRKCRETESGYEELKSVWQELRTNYRHDWLCALEILEIFEKENRNQEHSKEIRIYLEQKASNEAALNQLIRDGFRMINLN